jgi:hypothetical protein
MTYDDGVLHRATCPLEEIIALTADTGEVVEALADYLGVDGSSSEEVLAERLWWVLDRVREVEPKRLVVPMAAVLYCILHRDPALLCELYAVATEHGRAGIGVQANRHHRLLAVTVAPDVVLPTVEEVAFLVESGRGPVGRGFDA